MTRYANASVSPPVEITDRFTLEDGRSFSFSALEKLTPPELAELLVLPIEELDAPLGSRVIGRSLAAPIGGGVPEVLVLETIPFAELKAAQMEAIRAKRWRVETAGVLVDGVPISTDEKGQAKIAGAVQLFANDPSLASVDWEAQPGVWISIDQAATIATGIAVGRHVQACFSRARVLAEAIAAAETAEDLSAIDIEGGWPETAA